MVYQIQRYQCDGFYISETGKEVVMEQWVDTLNKDDPMMSKIVEQVRPTQHKLKFDKPKILAFNKN